jgi:hypothetical protein
MGAIRRALAAVFGAFERDRRRRDSLPKRSRFKDRRAPGESRPGPRAHRLGEGPAKLLRRWIIATRSREAYLGAAIEARRLWATSDHRARGRLRRLMERDLARAAKVA